MVTAKARIRIFFIDLKRVSLIILATDLPANIQIYVFVANLLGIAKYQELFQYTNHQD